MTSLPQGLAPQQVPSRRRHCLFPTSTPESSICSLLNREDLSLPLEMLKIRDFFLSHKKSLNESMKFSVPGLKKKNNCKPTELKSVSNIQEFFFLVLQKKGVGEKIAGDNKVRKQNRGPSCLSRGTAIF